MGGWLSGKEVENHMITNRKVKLAKCGGSHRNRMVIKLQKAGQIHKVKANCQQRFVINRKAQAMVVVVVKRKETKWNEKRSQNVYVVTYKTK
mgnify:CR=1 FL=1